MRLLTRLAFRRPPESPAPFISQGRKVENARLLGTSRCGLLSWSALLDGRKVKIYETHGAWQGQFIEWVSQHPDIGHFFPRVLQVSENLVTALWAEGTTLPKNAFRTDHRMLREVAALQARLHAVDPPAESHSAAKRFSYRDFLVARMNRFAAPWPDDERQSALLEQIMRRAQAGRLFITHPDLTPQNLVVTDVGLQIIDNELLTLSDYPLIDLFNTLRTLGRRRIERATKLYLEAYVEAGGDLEPLVSDQQFYEALWAVRSIGSHLQDGNFARARPATGTPETTRGTTSVLVQAARRIAGH